MKKIFVILALLGILVQSFSKAIILLNFQLNKEYVAKNLCVKKEIKGNCCKGSCHLKKQLDEDEKKSQHSGNTLKEKSEIQLFCQEKTTISGGQSGFVPEHNTIHPVPGITGMSSSIFHPPRC